VAAARSSAAFSAELSHAATPSPSAVAVATIWNFFMVIFPLLMEAARRGEADLLLKFPE
jgi:hypothetical protein